MIVKQIRVDKPLLKPLVKVSFKRYKLDIEIYN